MKNISFAIKVAVTVTLSGIVVNKVTAAALKLTNKTSHTITIENVSLYDVWLSPAEEKNFIKLPRNLKPGESSLFDRYTRNGFSSVEISVHNKPHLRKTFKLKPQQGGGDTVEIFTIGSEDQNDESLSLVQLTESFI